MAVYISRGWLQAHCTERSAATALLLHTHINVSRDIVPSREELCGNYTVAELTQTSPLNTEVGGSNLVVGLFTHTYIPHIVYIFDKIRLASSLILVPKTILECQELSNEPPHDI